MRCFLASKGIKATNLKMSEIIYAANNLDFQSLHPTRLSLTISNSSKNLFRKYSLLEIKMYEEIEDPTLAEHTPAINPKYLF